MTHTKEENTIELRSEKVRRIIRTRPSFILRWGTAAVFLVFAILLVLFFLAPYPYGHGETILGHIFLLNF